MENKCFLQKTNETDNIHCFFGGLAINEALFDIYFF